MTAKIEKRGQKGFTLIELIITIVIIGILAAVAIPKFQSLSNEADNSVAKGVAGALASATSVNYAKWKAAAVHTPLANCGDIFTNILALADVPATTTAVGPAATLLPTDGSSVLCTVTVNTVTATFQAYGAL